jgi:hypothetical protein
MHFLHVVAVSLLCFSLAANSLAQTLTSTFTSASNLGVNTGGLRDWVVPAGSSATGERKAGANLISVAGTMSGPIGSGNTTFVFNDGTPTVSGSAQNQATYSTSILNGLLNLFTVSAPLPAGAKGSLNVFLTASSSSPTGDTDFQANITGAQTGATIVGGFNPITHQQAGSANGYLSLNFAASSATTLTAQFYGSSYPAATFPNLASYQFQGATLQYTLPGQAQDNPILPTTSVIHGLPSHFFFDTQTGEWIDPPTVSEYSFTMTGNSKFTKILNFPTGFSGAFDVSVNGVSLGQFLAGQSVDFTTLLGHGVDSFNVSGITPGVDAASQTAFPIQLAFDTPTASFTMNPVVVPEPVSGMGCILSFTLMAKRSTRGRTRSA